MYDLSFDKSISKEHKRSNSLISPRLIFRALGVLLLVEMVFFLLCSFVSWIYDEQHSIDTFIKCSGINLTIGSIFILFSKGAKRSLSRRDGYVIASFAWILFSIFGMIPFYMDGSVDSLTNAFFETISGFTTTGATIMDNIEEQSHGILFWRSLTQWIGGLGIVCFVIAILPIFNEGNVQLFTAESIGVTHDKLHPKVEVMAKRIWIIYISLTAIEAILLWFGGMNIFDAICHSLTTTATGGYSTKQASIAYWNSPFIEYVITIFMFLSGINFTLYIILVKGKFSRIIQDEELKWYFRSVLTITSIIAGALYIVKGYDIENAFRSSIFQVVSLHTSCGFATDDYMLWPMFTWMLIIFAMLQGGCTGSTGGGLKNLRMVILSKSMRNVFKRMLHPNAVLPIRIGRSTLPTNIVHSVAIYIGIYMFTIFIGWTLLMMVGVDLTDSFSTVVSSIGNVGPGLGHYGPSSSWNALPSAAKWILSFLMLIGRLELYCVLVLLFPAFWYKR